MPLSKDRMREYQRARRAKSQKPRSPISNPPIPPEVPQYIYPLSKLRSLRMKEVPLTVKEACIYFLFSGDRIVYIGQSCRIFGRISAHLLEKEFDSVTLIHVAKEDLNSIEMAHIRAYSPPYNRIGIPSVPSVSTAVNPVTLEMFEALEWRVSDLEARFAVDGVVMDAVGSRRRGRSVVVGDSPEDLFKRVVAGKVARLGVR